MGILWGKSRSIERDNNDVRANGAKAYFYVGGTTTPLTVYQDSAESTPHAHPLEADGNGRWPAVFVPFCASYGVKVVTSTGTQLYYDTAIPNPDPVEASEDSVDENALLKTGMVVWEPVNTTRVGFVRLNGRTIGSASSGASERANADTEDLFTYYWTNLADAQAPVSGGRGASASADFAANKTITLLGGQSALLMGLDTMGNTAAGLLASAPFTNGDASTPGSVCGSNTQTLSEANLPAHTHSVSGTTSTDGAHAHDGTTASSGTHTHSVTDPGHTHTTSSGFATHTDEVGGGSLTGWAVGPSSIIVANVTGISIVYGGAHTHTFLTNSGGGHSHTVTGTAASVGSGTAHNNVSKALLGTFYQKL